MILTGKCREDFEYKYNMSNFNELDKYLQLCRTVEFFDSVNIYITIKRFCQGLEFKDWYYIISNEKGIYLIDKLIELRTDSRQEALEQAIIKANEIYNKNEEI